MLEKVKQLISGSGSEGYSPIDSTIYKEYNSFRPQGPQKLFCYVPFSNMSFSFEGRVLACAYNQKVELGHYPEQSVKEMWFESNAGKQLREHMLHNDLSYGCKHCKYFFDNRKFSGLKPLVFDRYSSIKGNGYPKVLEFELSSTCNLECVMCNGKVSSSIRKNRDKLPPIKSPYDDAFVEQLKEFVPYLEEAKFYGGEPLLIPIYYKIWDLILSINPKVRIFVITNGTTLDDRIKTMLEKGDFDLAVSMDSPEKETLESIRLNTDHGAVMQNINYFNDYCKRKGKNLVISFTLMRINWQEFPKIINFCNEIDAILYVSYLKTPPQFALWNLPSEELKSIKAELHNSSVISAGKASPHVLKNNQRCLEDLLIYLENCEETNRSRTINELLPSATESLEVSDVFSPEAEAGNHVQAEEPVHPAYEPKTDYRVLAQIKLRMYLNGSENEAFQKEKHFFDRLDEVTERYFDNIEKNKLFYYVYIYPIEPAYKDVQILPDSDLKNSIKRLGFVERT